MKAYNQKIIETPTYLEIYAYEAIITPKQKTENIETNPKRKKELAWLYEEENTITDKRKNYDELSAQRQYDSLKRKQKHYQNMRYEIARLIDPITTTSISSLRFGNFLIIRHIEHSLSFDTVRIIAREGNYLDLGQDSNNFLDLYDCD